MFTIQKAAQVSAYFAEKEGGTINVLKLVKLVYLADRLSLQTYHEPITWDHLVSMPYGPAPSQTRDYISGIASDGEALAVWEEWISDRDRHDVGLAKEINRELLDRVSDAEIQILNEVWQTFGKMNEWELVDYTHDHCPEWTDPNGSSVRIHERTLFQIFGKSFEEAVELAHDLDEQRRVNQAFASM